MDSCFCPPASACGCALLEDVSRSEVDKGGLRINASSAIPFEAVFGGGSDKLVCAKGVTGSFFTESSGNRRLCIADNSTGPELLTSKLCRVPNGAGVLAGCF